MSLLRSLKASSTPSLLWNGKAASLTRTRVTCRRLFSTETAVEETVGKDAVPEIVRHGRGDGVVTLNVGGSEFITLRSTVGFNPVLSRHVANAERNQEFTKGAVFIDRDPSQFGLILQHLRNQADSLQSSSSIQKISFWKKKGVMIQIPKDRAKARDLYVEARYFQIKELEDLLCSYDMFTRFSSWVGGGSANPFHTATRVIKDLRRALLASSGFGIILGTQNDGLMDNLKGMASDIAGIVTGKKTKAIEDGSNASPA